MRDGLEEASLQWYLGGNTTIQRACLTNDKEREDCQVDLPVKIVDQCASRWFAVASKPACLTESQKSLSGGILSIPTRYVYVDNMSLYLVGTLGGSVCSPIALLGSGLWLRLR